MNPSVVEGIEMENGILLCQSKYGTTKKYVKWLAESTQFACVETTKAKIEDVKNYDTVVLCDGIYASGIAGLSFLRKNYKKLQGKKMAVLCVGASPYDPSALEGIRAHNLRGDLRQTPLYLCQRSVG